MVTNGVDVLVIATIDGTTLSNALENAHFAGIDIIAYDRLIRGSEHVSYYATFDNFQVGVQQAESLVSGLESRFGSGPWNVECEMWNCSAARQMITTRSSFTMARCP